MLSRLRSFLTVWTRRERFEDGLDEELRFHLASSTDDLVRAGLPHAEAARLARVRFGSVDHAKDGSRRARGLELVDELTQHLRFAVRLLVKDRWHTLGAAFVLALAIGVTTAMFTVVNAVLLRGLPVDDERIVFVGTRDARGRDAGVSLPDFSDWQEGAETLRGMAAYTSTGVNVGDDVQPPALVPATLVSANLFRLVGAQPALGREFSRAEERPGAAGTVVLGHALWQSRYSGDPGIVGRTIRIDSRPAVVIGVMPEGFRFPLMADLWLPLGFRGGPVLARDVRRHRAVGRLANGATMDGARAELEAIAARAAKEHPETNAGLETVVQRHSRRVVAPLRGFLLLLMAAVCLVLLIACANVGGLLLYRSAHRTAEIAQRTALGASRAHILRQVLVESTLLAAVGCVLGGVVAVAAVDFISGQVERCQLRCMPYWIEWTPDLRVLAFGCVTGLAAGLLSGLAPALHACSHPPSEALRQAGRTGGSRVAERRWTSGLLVAQIALTLVLLIGTGAAARSFAALYEAAGVVEGKGLLTFTLIFGDGGTTEDRKTFLRAVKDRLAAMPELAASTLSRVPPLGGGVRRSVEIHGRPPDEPLPVVTYLPVADDYFETLGLRLLEGRPFGPRDGEPGRERVIVNEAFVDTYLPDEEPLGKRLRLHRGPGPTRPRPWITIAAVSPTVAQRSNPVADAAEPVVYVPIRGDPGYGATVIVRPRSAGAPVLDRIREELATVDRDLALHEPMPLTAAMASSRRWERALLTMLGAFAGLALILASVGVYSATACAAAQRTREIGLRMALGAPRTRVVRHFMRRSMMPVAVGLALGVAAAAIVGRVPDNWLVRASATDQLTFLACAALVAAIALAACFVSARHATHIDPVSVLRSS